VSTLFQELQRRNVFRVGIAYAVVAWVLLQVVDLVLDNIDAPAWIMKVFMLAVAVGFPVALIFAWAFEKTPEGIKLEKNVDRSQSITPQTGRKLDRLIIVFLAVAVIVLLGERFGSVGVDQRSVPAEVNTDVIQVSPPARISESPVHAPEKSIAVLPFVNMSADPDNEYFSDGIAEEILNVLARIPDLKVAARTSAFAYKGSNASIADIARDLKVETVLEGSVRKSGNQVRVTAQLIKAADGYHLWSETYDHELTNIFAIQDQIARSIAEALKVTLAISSGTAGNMTGTTSTEAYDSYLRGMNQWHLRTGESLRNSIELFEQAIAIDPKFARAWAGLALTYAVISDYTDLPREECYEKARRAAATALDLDPGLAEAAAALANSTSDPEEQLSYARRAVQLGPSFATAHQWYASLLALSGDHEAALQEFLLGYGLDPRSRIVGTNMAEHYMLMGQWSDAERVLKQVLSYAPDFYYAHQVLFRLRLVTGDLEGAREEGRRVARLLGRDESSVQVYLDLFSEGDKKQAAIKALMSWPREHWWREGNPSLDQYGEAGLLARAGAWSEARTLLKAYESPESVVTLATMRVDRTLAAFNCSPETQAIYASAGLPELVVPFPCDQGAK